MGLPVRVVDKAIKADVCDGMSIDEDLNIPDIFWDGLSAPILDHDLQEVVRVERNPNGLEIALGFDTVATTIAEPIVDGIEVAD
jgi:hypothetical protein